MNTRSKQAPRGQRTSRPAMRLAIAAALLCAAITGCIEQQAELDTEYGRCRTAGATDSINGMKGLVNLFEQHGFRPLVTDRISPQIHRFDTVVWVYHQSDPPSRKQVARMEEWLSGTGKTLVFIGSDYSGEKEYWQAMLEDAPEDKVELIERELAKARNREMISNHSLTDDAYIGWYTQRRGDKSRKIAGLDGPLAEDVETAETGLSVWSYLDVPREEDRTDPDDGVITRDSFPIDLYEDEYSSDYVPPDYVFDGKNFTDIDLNKRQPISHEILLEARTGEGNDPIPLIFRLDFSELFTGEAIIVNNAAFLSNFGLVNHQRRQIADNLVRLCDQRSENHKVLFIDGYRGSPVHEYESVEGTQGFEALMVWPVNWILLHLMILGILYCFARYPIFGRPRQLPERAETDFGQHIEALGRHLKAIGEESHARALISHYHETSKDET